MVFAAYHMRDAHFIIIDHDREVEEWIFDAPCDDEIFKLFRIKRYIAANEVVESHWNVGILKTNDFFIWIRITGLCFIRQALFNELFQVAAVCMRAFRLPKNLGKLIGNTEPFQTFADVIFMLSLASRRIGIFETKIYFAAGMCRKKIIKECGTRTSYMEGACR